jgi:hypothetical protein
VRSQAIAGAALAAVLHPFGLVAQRGVASHAALTARFTADARAGTRRYQSQEAAIADGYRRVGVDFPAMGEHWVNLQRVMADSFAPPQPSVLVYVRVNGTPTLAGVAYTALLEPGEDPPSFGPARSFWHEHNGTVAEESFPIGHHAGEGRRGTEGGALRLAILHAWVWAENPSGLFATDNWTLPFLRLGIAPPATWSPTATRALALALDGEEYYALMLRTSMPLTVREEALAAAILSRAREQARSGLSTPRGQRHRARAADEAHLSVVWSAMWEELEGALPQRVIQLRALRRHLERTPSG